MSDIPLESVLKFASDGSTLANLNGYHTAVIPKAKYGTSLKISEELAEFLDAERQNCKIMCILELSDLIGAIEGYLESNFSDITLDDLIKMKDITKRVFKNGYRK